MKITTQHVQISTSQDSENKESFLNSHQALSGFGFSLELFGRFLLCTRKDSKQLYIVGTPSKRWDGDLKDEGFEIVQVLTPEAIEHLISILTQAATKLEELS